MDQFKRLSIIVIILLVILGGFFFPTMKSAEMAIKDEKIAKLIVYNILNESASAGWDKNFFNNRISNNLKEWFSKKGKQEVLPFRDLGKFVEFDKDIQKFKMNKKTDGNSKENIARDNIDAIFVADFEKDRVYMEMKLSKYDNKWLVDSIFMNPTKAKIDFRSIDSIKKRAP
ncbi:hypothetical protein N9W34_05275 [Rickettsiales bacterium]|nr:hypothetical protein [Rickettsiales bacterium]